jgi:GMP synthase-like glutamine amidotransferase
VSVWHKQQREAGAYQMSMTKKILNHLKKSKLEMFMFRQNTKAALPKGAVNTTIYL